MKKQLLVQSSVEGIEVEDNYATEESSAPPSFYCLHESRLDPCDNSFHAFTARGAREESTLNGAFLSRSRRPSNDSSFVDLQNNSSQVTKSTWQIQEEMETTVLRCPCYQESFDMIPGSGGLDAARQVISEHAKTHQRVPSREKSLLTAAESFEDDESQTSELFGTLENGNEYTLRKIVVEGSLHKRGTGRDWMGSKGWKARWARLALARVEGYGDLDVPLLCISWYRNSAVCSNVIVLDGMVVLKADAPETQKWHKFRFDIHLAATTKGTTSPTRTFTAPSQKARDAWVYTISQELLSFEKQKAAHSVRRQQRLPPLSGSRKHHLRLTLEDGWSSSERRSPRRPSSPVTSLPTFPKVPKSPSSPRTVIPDHSNTLTDKK